MVTILANLIKMFWGRHCKRASGPQYPLIIGTVTPEEIIGLFSTLRYSNYYMQTQIKMPQKIGRRGKNLPGLTSSLQEFTKYLVTLRFMSVYSLQNFRFLSWPPEKSIFQVAFPSTVMSRDRFRAISSILHISDPEKDAINDQKRGTEDYEPLQKVKPPLDIIRNTCKSIYHPKQHISVDERMVATKARFSIKQLFIVHEHQHWFLVISIDFSAIESTY